VDDGSTDCETIAILEGLNKPKTTVIHQANRGLPAARNRGIREAKGKYVFPLDADDRTLLEKGVWIMESHAQVGFVNCWLKHFGRESWIWSPPAYNFYKLLIENTVVGNSLIRKTAWESVGGYNENMTQGYEDWDFWITLSDYGWMGYQIPEVLFFYRKHGQTMLSHSNVKHGELTETIRNNHPHLYEEKRLAQLKSKWCEGEPIKTAENWPQGADAYEVKLPDADKIRIMFILPWLEVGGAEKVMLELIEGLPKEKFEITLVTTVSSKNGWNDRFDETLKHIFHLPNYFEQPEHMEAVLLQIIRSRDIQIIHISNSELGYQAVPAVKKRWPHIQVAAHLHAYVPELPWDYVRKSVSFNEYIDRYVVIKRSLQKVLTSTFRIPEDKVALIENGVDVEMYVPANEDEKQLIKQELGLPQDKKIISWIGRLSLDKDPLKFVAIARQLADLDPSDQVRCLIVGDEPLRTDVANKIA
jgi:hypothetical protein